MPSSGAGSRRRRWCARSSTSCSAPEHVEGAVVERVDLLELDRPVTEQADPLGVEVEQEQREYADEDVGPEVLGVADLLLARVPDLGGPGLIVAARDLGGVAQRLGIGGGAQVLERVGQ